MDWVPDLIGTPPRRERNGGHQTEKTNRVETRRLVDQSESVELEIAVEIETQRAVQKPAEIEKRETESNETRQIQSDETGETRETEIVALQVRLESEIAEFERLEQRRRRRLQPRRGRAQRGRRRRSDRRQGREQSESAARRRRSRDRRRRRSDGARSGVQRRPQAQSGHEKPQSRDAEETQGQDQLQGSSEGGQTGWEGQRAGRRDRRRGPARPRLVERGRQAPFADRGRSTGTHREALAPGWP